VDRFKGAMKRKIGCLFPWVALGVLQQDRHLVLFQGCQALRVGCWPQDTASCSQHPVCPVVSPPPSLSDHTGKTVQALAFLGYLAQERGIWGPFLVITPASTLHNWDNELHTFCPFFKVGGAGSELLAVQACCPGSRDCGTAQPKGINTLTLVCCHLLGTTQPPQLHRRPQLQSGGISM
jgi:hypothetical protein